MNEAFQEYKRSIDIHCATLVIKSRGMEVKPLHEEEIDIELPEEIERGYIELDPMTPEEQRIYEEFKRKRNQRVFEKFKGEERWKRNIFTHYIKAISL